jgi:hypothetical protein
VSCNIQAATEGVIAPRRIRRNSSPQEFYAHPFISIIITPDKVYTAAALPQMITIIR